MQVSHLMPFAPGLLGFRQFQRLQLLDRFRQFLSAAKNPPFADSFCAVAEFPGNGAGLPGSAAPLRFPTGASFIMACPARAPNTNPSSRELLANRLAPCTPVAAVSPAAYRPGSEVRPHRSVFTPPIM